MPSFLIALNVYIISFLVPKTDLEIRWGGGSSRPLEKGGGPVSKNSFFGPWGLSLV